MKRVEEERVGERGTGVERRIGEKKNWEEKRGDACFGMGRRKDGRKGLV